MSCHIYYDPYNFYFKWLTLKNSLFILLLVLSMKDYIIYIDRVFSDAQNQIVMGKKIYL